MTEPILQVENLVKHFPVQRGDAAGEPRVVERAQLNAACAAATAPRSMTTSLSTRRRATASSSRSPKR